MTAITILYHSGYGHTARQAMAVRDGAAEAEGVTVTTITIDQEGAITDTDWQALETSDAVIFGTPTYMGGPSWQFKKLADASSRPWSRQRWKDKIAAGFTNSGTINGDKFSTISYLFTLAMQHGMIWVGTGMKASGTKSAQRGDINYLGGFAGAIAQSPTDSSAEEAPHEGDLETARLFGRRVADITKRMRSPEP